MASTLHNTAQVSQFISTTVYYLLFGITADQTHPAVQRFQSFIQNILTCSSNNVTASVILTSLLYVSRFVTQQKIGVLKRNYSASQVWITCLMLADVTMNDSAYAIRSWSEVTGTPIKQLIAIRRDFLEVLGYDIHVSQAQYSTWISSLQLISAHVSAILYYHKPIQQTVNYRQLACQPLMRISQTYAISPVSLSPPENCFKISPTRDYHLENYVHPLYAKNQYRRSWS